MRKAPVIALSGVLGIALVWLVVSRNNGETVKHSGLDGHAPSEIEVTGLQNPDNEEINIGTDAPESGESAVIAKPVTLEPVDVRQWRMSHGYYGSGSNDPGAKHPYEYYDLETLEQLALNDDGLAQFNDGDETCIFDRARRQGETVLLAGSSQWIYCRLGVHCHG